MSLLFSIIGIASGLISDARVKPLPKGSRFDWDAYWKDIEDGMDCMTQLKKCERLEYYTTNPQKPKWWELPLDTVVDVERYENDKKRISERYAEHNRQLGEYRQIKPFKKG